MNQDRMRTFTPNHSNGARDRGATMVEYGLMVALVALIAFSAVQMLGHRTEASFTTAAQALDEGTAGGGDESVSAGPSDGDDSSNGGSADTQGSPTTTTPSPAPTLSDDSDLGQQGGGTTSTTLPPTTTTTAPATTTTTAPKPGSTATVANTSSSFYWWNATKQGGDGAWKASVTFSNDWVRHQYLTLEITQVDDKGKTKTITVNDFYVPANGSASFEQWDNSYSVTNNNTKGIVSVSVKVVSVKTADLNWQTVTYSTPDSTASTVSAPKIP